MANPKKSAQQQDVDTKEPTTWDKAVASLAGGYAAAGELAKDALHQGTQDVVSQFLGLNDISHAQQQAVAKEPEHQPEQQQEPQHEKSEDLER